MKHSHYKLEKMAQEYLISIGYINTELEHKVKVGNRTYIIDVYGEKERKINNQNKPETIAIECGDIDATKLAVISTQFDKIIIWETNVETRKNEYVKRILKLSTKLAEYKKDLETERKERRKLSFKLTQEKHKKQNKMNLYSKIILVCLHELAGDSAFQRRSSTRDENIERIIPRLVDAFHLAFKMLLLEDSDYKIIKGEKGDELQELQRKFEKLIPEIEKRSDIEDWY